MKKIIFIALALLTSFTMFQSCDDDANNVGVQIQPDTDKLSVGTDTFHLSTETVQIKNIISRPDSLLLGTYVDDFIGSTNGEILSEFILPTKGFTYLPSDKATTVADSVVLTLYFSSYFGNPNAPLNISVYELKKGLDPKKEYTTDLDVKEFVDYTKKVGSSVISVVNPETGRLSSRVDIKLSADFLNRFYTTNPELFKSQEAFKEFFKGLYITADFGSSTMLVISSLKLRLNYHYYYNNEPTSIIESYHDFWATQEVKRVNRLLHPFRIPTITSDANFNVVASPANYYTRVRIPLKRMRQRIKNTGKELDVNAASLRLDVQDRSNYNGSQIPYVKDLMLIKESELEGFFEDHLLTSDTLAFIAKLDSTRIDTRKFKYHYNFNKLATLIENEVKNDSTGKDYLDMMILPVKPIYKKVSSYGSSYLLKAINQSMNMQATKIYSGQNSDIPMKIEILYSEF